MARTLLLRRFVTTTSTSDASEHDLRKVAFWADLSSTSWEPLSLVWPTLVTRARTVVDCFATDSRSFLVLLESPDSTIQPVQPLQGRTLEVVERVLLGHQQKVVAADLKISPATVADVTRATLTSLGLRCSASKAPFPLCLLVYAHRYPHEEQIARVSELHRGGAVLRVISMPSPDRVLVTKVSPAETAVLKLQVEGKSHAEIAHLRRSSARTIANQLASAWKKLGVSGRGELLRYLSQSAY